MRELLDELGLRPLVVRIGLSFHVGASSPSRAASPS
jgi:hypothetical protein